MATKLMFGEIPFVWEDIPSLLGLGLVRGSDEPIVAGMALEGGMDSSTLRRVAGRDTHETASTAGELGDSLRQLGVNIPAPQEAVRRLALRLSRAMLAGGVDVVEATRFLAGLSPHVFPDDLILHPFIYADSELDDRPAERALFERMALAAAEDIVRQGT